MKASDSNLMKLNRWENRVRPPLIRNYGRPARHVLVLGVGSDGGVRGELELADGGNIGGGREQLEGGLLLRVSNVDGNLGGTKVLQGGSRGVGVLNPRDSLFLTRWPRGGGNWGGGLRLFAVSDCLCARERK